MSIGNLSLAHTSWNCKYHIVFAPKYRRKAFFGQKRLDIGAILRKLCEWKGIQIREAEVCPGHVHMLISIPPKLSVSGVVGYLKGNPVMIFQKWGNAAKIAEYIQDRLKGDNEAVRLSTWFEGDPFTGQACNISERWSVLARRVTWRLLIEGLSARI